MDKTFNEEEKTMRQETENVYTLWTYDVWGNEDDGFMVNDRFMLADNMIIKPDASDEQIVNLLRSEGYLYEHVTKNDLEIDGDDTYLYINEERNGYPLFELTLN